MPRAQWGISASDVDNFDRDSQYVPYDGPIPSNGVYLWQIASLQSIKGDRKTLPSLRVGLRLVPREDRDEDKYDGYFQMAFLPISDKTTFRYVPFLDAIGVSGSEFINKTLTDEEGKIKRIGTWRNTGEELICAELKDNDPDFAHKNPKQVGMFLPADDYYGDEDDEEYDDDEEEPV